MPVNPNIPQCEYVRETSRCNNLRRLAAGASRPMRCKRAARMRFDNGGGWQRYLCRQHANFEFLYKSCIDPWVGHNI